MGKVFSDNEKKVLFFINYVPPDYGGGYLRAFRQAKRLNKLGRLSSIITLTKSEKFTDEELSRDDILFLNSKFLLFLDLFIFLYKRKNEISTIYIVSPQWYTLICSLYAKFFSIKILIGVTLKGVDSPVSKGKNWFLQLYYRIKQLQFYLADSILVNSPALMEEIKNNKRLYRKTVLLPNPVDLDVYKPIQNCLDKKVIREKLNLPLEKKIVLFVGAVSFRKGVDRFYRYLDQLVEMADVILVICGNRSYPESNLILNNLFEKFNDNQTKRVYFREEVYNVYEYMQVCDLFMFPSLNEGLPNVLLEAMACQIPILSNRLEGITDYLLPNEFLVDDDIDEYVNKSLSILSNKKPFESILFYNFSKINNEFSTKKIDDMFLHLVDF